MGPLQTRNGFCTLRGAFSQRPYLQQCTHHFAGQSSAISDFEFSFPQNLIISDVAMSSEKDRDLDNQVINSHFDNRNSGAHVWGTPPKYPQDLLLDLASKRRVAVRISQRHVTWCASTRSSEHAPSDRTNY